MTTKLMATFAFLLLFTVSSFAQKNASNSGLSSSSTQVVSEASQARSFGLSMVQAYFDGNCDVVYNALANQITSMESGEVFVKSQQLHDMFCKINPLRTDIQVSYAMYLSNYTATIMTAEEFISKHPQLQSVYNLQAGDYYFNGGVANAGATELFTASDMVIFVLRKSGSGFIITAM